MAMIENKYTITKSSFCSDGLSCAGTLYMPDGARGKIPIVVMGHGFAAERCFRLPAFADVFARNGFAVYFFDYRSFGESQGEPRHHVSPKRHQQDWHKAIAHVRGIAEIDLDKIAIWGSSFSGGHVLQVGAESPHVSAIISQVPHVDGLATAACSSPFQLLQASYAGVRDVFSSLILGKPYYSPVVGRVNEFAAMNKEEVWDGWRAIIPKESAWKNEVQSRIFLELPFYSPVKFASKINVPTLIIAGEYDSITPPKAAKKAAEKIKNSEFCLLKCNHFQAYTGDTFDKNVAIQLDFLRRKLFAA